MKNQLFNSKNLPIYILLTLGMVARLLPHAPNFTPIGAIAIFGGLYLPKRLSIALPLLVMLASDIFIGFYDWKIMLSVYLGFVIVSLIALVIRKNPSFIKITASTLLGSTIFFLITNLAVWLFGTMYQFNLTGLLNCYYMAIPFFRNSLLGDIFYTGVLVGGYELIKFYTVKKVIETV